MTLTERIRRSEERPGEAAASSASAALGGVIIELAKLVRKLLVIPVQLLLALAELAGTAVLGAWRRVVRPLLAAVLAVVAGAYRLALRKVRPVHGVAAAAVAAIVALVASQWLDYRGITVGADAYPGGVGLVAPAPEVESARTGEAHAWLILPLALVALLVIALAFRGRARLARLLIPIGALAILISLVVDLSKGLDEGAAAIAYEGAEASLLEGFWVQTVAGAVLVACGLLLPRYVLSSPAPVRAPTGRPHRPTRRSGERTGAKPGRGPLAKRPVQGAGT